MLGTLRFLYGWSLKPLIYLSLAPVLSLSIYAASDPDLRVVVGLAWDAGAVTTGPVTVPLVLALGIGIASAAGESESGLSGFGIVTLASLFPIIGVLLLALYVSASATPAEIIAAAGQTDPFKRFKGFFVEPALGRDAAKKPETRSGPGLNGKRHVVQNAEGGNDRGDLKRACQA